MNYLLLITCHLFLVTNQPDTLRISSRDTQHDKWFAKDKFHHFSYSLGIVGLSYHIYHCQFNNDNPGARTLAISLGACAGIGKEIWDKLTGNNISYKDLTADLLGIAIGTLLFTFP